MSEISQVEMRDAVDVIDRVKAEVLKSSVIHESSLYGLMGAVVLGESALLSGLPGTGKTYTANALATATGGKFGRVQGTPDKLPADITGTEIYRAHTGDFDFLPGPIFSNLLLVDEINRMSPKTQSALLEAMQEGQVTVGADSRKLPKPFSVLATHNPDELGQGTNPLTRANTDRFLVGIEMPSDPATEAAIFDRTLNPHQSVEVADLNEILATKEATLKVALPPAVRGAVLNLTNVVKEFKQVDSMESQLSGGRKNIGIARLAMFYALARESRTATIEDVKQAALFVLPHRVELTDAALDEGFTSYGIVEYAAEQI